MSHQNGIGIDRIARNIPLNNTRAVCRSRPQSRLSRNKNHYTEKNLTFSIASLPLKLTIGRLPVNDGFHHDY